MALARIIKHSDIQYAMYSTSMRREIVNIYKCDGATLDSIIDEIDSLKVPGSPDQILLHRDSGGNITKVEWRTFQKVT